MPGGTRGSITISQKTILLPILKENVSDIRRVLDGDIKHIYSSRELKLIFRKTEPTLSILQNTSLSENDLISFLIEHGSLHKITFNTPKTEALYVWGKVSRYLLMPDLRPRGYYSHLTAMHFHGLLNYAPTNTYFNNEQPARPGFGILEQTRIHNSFKNKQRITSAKTDIDGITYWLLNGKQSGNYAVTHMSTPDGVLVSCTSLERTLIDITVRPAYAGGPKNVLRAFRVAQPNVSIDKLKLTLEKLSYVYPYHQSIGFYLDQTGTYGDQALKEFLSYQPFNFDFYLDYGMKTPAYSAKWRIFYPSDLTHT